jgi:hypothetical protein
MATLYAKKDGTGTHSTIQSAIYDAVDGDIISISAGLWEENIDLYKGVKLVGAGKALTIIQGSIKTNLTKSGTWALGSTTLNIPAGTEGLVKGRIVSGSGIAANTRIASISATSITISIPTTAAKTSATTITMAQQNDATIRVRGSGSEIKDLKVIGFDASSPAVEYAAIYYKNTGLGSSAATNYLLDNCHVVADGEYAILTDAAAGVGNGIIQNCLITGKTFTGNNPASGNQFTVANVPRQLVTIQSVNMSTSFLNNVVMGVTGGLTVDGVPSFNTAVTMDAPGTVSGNIINGTHGYGYALRCRGASTVVGSNTNYSISPNTNAGFLIGPTGSQSSGLNIGTNVSIETLLMSIAQASAGQPVSVSVSKQQLKVVSKVSSNASFSDESSWEMVTYVFKHNSSRKRLVSGNKNLSASKPLKLKSALSGERYEIIKMIISKADGSKLVLKRSDISDASSFDFTLL